MKYFLGTAALLLVLLTACNTVKRVPEGSYLLRSNTLNLRSDKTITNKGVLQDQLNLIIVQKPNTRWSGVFPFKLWRYNLKSDRYASDPNIELPKGLERPVIYDSALETRTVSNMQNFLFNQGYFNALVTDTVKFKRRRAYVTYNVNTGLNYLIDNVIVDADDSTVAAFVRSGLKNTKFKKETAYSKSLADEERARLIEELQNIGYYRFSQDNIIFELDTVSKERFRDAENLFESAINFLTLQKREKKLSVDIKVIIRKNFDSLSYAQYDIGRVMVFPDFVDRSTAFDSNMIVTQYDSIIYRYHRYYVHENAINRQLFVRPGERYSRANHQLTVNKLNEMGIFQMVNIYFVEDTARKDKHVLNCYVTLSPSKKIDGGASLEITNAITYFLGSSLALSFREKNLFKGANSLSIMASSGIELNYNEAKADKIADRFTLQSTNFGVNATLSFAKFISPFRPKWIDKRNLPRTQFLLGVNVLDRLDQFRLSNISSAFSYNWRQSLTNTWDLGPAFANIILSDIRPAFQSRLDSNEALRNTYRRTLIEGENLFFTFSDQEVKAGRDYSYVRVGFEEAGILLSGINAISKKLNNDNGFIFDRYVKIDLDARHYFKARHSTLATRFLAGIGNPYGDSRTLPYIKQYFVGGAYSIRGWQARRLVPDSLRNTNVDKTGDIKLEASTEYRFDMIRLFSGVLNLNGALFADAGNTWLAKKNANAPYADFDISRLGHDIAVSTGAGLRVIVADFFTVRFDAAFPIKNPYVAENNGWVLRKVDLGNSTWRKNNVVINFAIGMPF